jgi:hypothetical protein
MVISSRFRSAGQLPWLTHEDVAFAAKLPLPWSIALALPKRRHASVPSARGREGDASPDRCGADRAPPRAAASIH